MSPPGRGPQKGPQGNRKQERAEAQLRQALHQAHQVPPGHDGTGAEGLGITYTSL